jgi:hypothetical protein
MMNWIPQIDWRFSGVLCAVCVILFVWAGIQNDYFGVLVCSISAVTNFACAVFSYTIRDIVRQERRQHFIQLTIGE